MGLPTTLDGNPAAPLTDVAAGAACGASDTLDLPSSPGLELFVASSAKCFGGVLRICTRRPLALREADPLAADFGNYAPGRGAACFRAAG